MMNTLKESILRNIKQDDTTIKRKQEIEVWLAKYAGLQAKPNVKYSTGYWEIRDDFTIYIKGLGLAFKNYGKELPDFIHFNTSSEVQVMVFNSCDFENWHQLPLFCERLHIRNCPNIKSMFGAPSPETDLYIVNCEKLDDLIGVPVNLNGDFEVSGCPRVKSLDHIPSKCESFTWVKNGYKPENPSEIRKKCKVRSVVEI